MATISVVILSGQRISRFLGLEFRDSHGWCDSELPARRDYVSFQRDHTETQEWRGDKGVGESDRNRSLNSTHCQNCQSEGHSDSLPLREQTPHGCYSRKANLTPNNALGWVMTALR